MSACDQVLVSPFVGMWLWGQVPTHCDWLPQIDFAESVKIILECATRLDFLEAGTADFFLED
jgi:hypothetical protein